MILVGEVSVTPDGGEALPFAAEDLVVFPTRLSCTWEVLQAVHKHYHFD